MTSLLILDPRWLNQYQKLIKVLTATWEIVWLNLYIRNQLLKEINTLISALKDTATGFDEMNSMSLKISSEIPVKPLNNICNLSLTQGIFPSQLKIANDIPLYKSDDPMLFNDYRLVSVLCVISNMYDRVSTFLEIFKILHENQYSFRKESSTHLAFLSFVDKLYKLLKKVNKLLVFSLIFQKPLILLAMIFCWKN